MKAKNGKKAVTSAAKNTVTEVQYKATGAGTKAGKELADKANKGQAAQVYQALTRKGPLSFKELMAELGGKREMGSAAKDPVNNVRWYLSDMRKKGLVSSGRVRVERAKAA